MTNKEIKLLARKNISQNMGNCVSLTAFLFAVFVFLGLCELALFLLFKRIGWEYFFSWQGIKDHVSVRLFWFLDLIVVIPFAAFEMWTVRRFFVDIARADSYVGSRQYINSHSCILFPHHIFFHYNQFTEIIFRSAFCHIGIQRLLLGLGMQAQRAYLRRTSLLHVLAGSVCCVFRTYGALLDIPSPCAIYNDSKPTHQHF